MFSDQFYEERLSVREGNMKLLLETVMCIIHCRKCHLHNCNRDSHLHNYNKKLSSTYLLQKVLPAYVLQKLLKLHNCNRNKPLWTHMGHKGWRKGGKTFIRCYTISLKLWDEFNANFVLLYFSSYSSIKMWLFSQKCGEKQEGSVFKVGPHLSFLKPFQY